MLSQNPCACTSDIRVDGGEEGQQVTGDGETISFVVRQSRASGPTILHPTEIL
jgi:hypothetical protein